MPLTTGSITALTFLQASLTQSSFHLSLIKKIHPSPNECIWHSPWSSFKVRWDQIPWWGHLIGKPLLTAQRVSAWIITQMIDIHIRAVSKNILFYFWWFFFSAEIQIWKRTYFHLSAKVCRVTACPTLKAISKLHFSELAVTSNTSFFLVSEWNYEITASPDHPICGQQTSYSSWQLNW